MRKSNIHLKRPRRVERAQKHLYLKNIMPAELPVLMTDMNPQMSGGGGGGNHFILSRINTEKHVP